jgi:HEAT repeat protein
MGAAAASHPDVIPALLHSLCSDRDRLVCMSSAQALGAMGAKAARYPGVISGLLRSMDKDHHPGVRSASAEALGKWREPARGDLDPRAAQLQPEVLRARRTRQELRGELARAAADLKHAHSGPLPIMPGTCQEAAQPVCGDTAWPATTPPPR